MNEVIVPLGTSALEYIKEHKEEIIQGMRDVVAAFGWVKDAIMSFIRTLNPPEKGTERSGGWYSDTQRNIIEGSRTQTEQLGEQAALIIGGESAGGSAPRNFSQMVSSPVIINARISATGETVHSSADARQAGRDRQVVMNAAADPIGFFLQESPA